MKQLFFLSFLIATLIAFGSAKVKVKRDDSVEPDYQTATDISYGQYEKNKLDIYYDKNNLAATSPVVIYVHGGYWCEGDKQEDVNIGTRIQSEDYVVVIPNYRLYPEVNTIDDMVIDIYNVILWTKDNIANYGGNNELVTLIGFNAGAHIASLTLLKCAFDMVVNGIRLTKQIGFKNVILYNSPFTFENFERLEYEISKMRDTALSDPSQAKLENYANAKEGLLIGKGGYDLVEILEEKDDLSVYNIGTDKITFIECDKDIFYPIGSSQEMMEEIKRVVDDIEIIKEVYPGNYDYIIQGVRDNDPDISNNFMKYIRSSYLFI